MFNFHLNPGNQWLGCISFCPIETIHSCLPRLFTLSPWLHQISPWWVTKNDNYWQMWAPVVLHTQYWCKINLNIHTQNQSKLGSPSFSKPWLIYPLPTSLIKLACYDNFSFSSQKKQLIYPWLPATKVSLSCTILLLFFLLKKVALHNSISLDSCLCKAS